MASIRERSSVSGNTTWAVLYRLGGKQASTTFTDEKKALKFKALCDALDPAQALKVYAEQQTAGLTVDDLAQRFFAAKALDVTPRTMTDYRRDYENWIKPWLGHRAAAGVDEGDVQKWVDHMRAQLSPKSVRDRHMILHSMFKWGRAKSRRLVDHNPCEETELPKKPPRGLPKGITTPEFRALLAAAAEVNPEAHDLILFLGETGWRWSEAAALDVRDVEDDGRSIWVTVTRVFRVDGNYRQMLVEDAAKSAMAFRRIRPLPAAQAMLRQRVIGKGSGDLVFTNSRGRAWSQNTFLRDTWPRIIKAAGLEERGPTPHWLRHMHVAVMYAAGATTAQMQRRVGHENSNTTTAVYGGLIGDVDDEAISNAAALVAGERNAPTIAPSVLGEVVGGDVLLIEE